MAPQPQTKYTDKDDQFVLYIAHDHARKGRHVVKFGITKLMPAKRLQHIRGGFNALIRGDKKPACSRKRVVDCYGNVEDWAMERVWRFNSRHAAEEAEKLSVAIALSESQTRPLGNDYVSNLDMSKAEAAVERAIRRVRHTARRSNFNLRVASIRRQPGTRERQGKNWQAAPPRPEFKIRTCDKTD